jgi:hypothetical protein
MWNCKFIRVHDSSISVRRWITNPRPQKCFDHRFNHRHNYQSALWWVVEIKIVIHFESFPFKLGWRMQIDLWDKLRCFDDKISAREAAKSDVWVTTTRIQLEKLWGRRTETH